MDAQKIHEQYSIFEGSIKSFHLNIENKTVEVELLAKRKINGKISGEIHEVDFLPCTLKITFEELIEVSLHLKFPTEGDLIELRLHPDPIYANDNIALLMMVHDSSTYEYGKPNWKIKAKKISWKEV